MMEEEKASEGDVMKPLKLNSCGQESKE